MAAIARLAKELKEIERDAAASGVHATPVGADMFHWKGVIKGPSGTAYEGGRFHVDIALAPDYPFSPPRMKFETRVWHPNVSSQTGAICLDILKKEWSPALTIKTALLSLCALLSAPEPSDPQDAVVASQYTRERPAFEAQARAWAVQYAGAGPSDGSSSSGSGGGGGGGGGSGGGGGGSAQPAPPLQPIPADVDAAAVAALEAMGFARAAVIDALRRKRNNLEAATEVLLGGG